MTSVLGGLFSEAAFEEAAASVHDEPWYEHDTVETDGYALGLVHHGERDSGGALTYDDGDRTAVVSGAITNRGELDCSTDKLFESLFEDPVDLLARLDGPFAIAAIDPAADRMIVATDRLGTRPCYYLDDGTAFASGLAPLLTQIDDPTIDERAVSDMLLMGYVWGEKTLVEGITRLPPATVLEYDGGEVSTERYWSPSFDALPGEGYLDGLTERYRTVVGDTAGTIEDDAGLWLSGGLDSRTLAGELARHAGQEFGDLETYTYDANPSGGGNPALARRVADHLDVDIDQVELTPELFLEHLGEAVDHTDGMLRWSSFLNLLSVYALPDDHAGVLLEGAGQGELMGHHLRRYHFTGTDSPVESMYWSEAMVDHETVSDLLASDIDPLQSFVETAEHSDARTQKGTILEAHFDNYYARMTLASNEIPRSQAGMRVPFVNREFLEYAARLPYKYRIGTVPFTKGAIPLGVTQAKLTLTRDLDPDLAAIRYERTGLAPTYPYPLHIAGFLTTTAAARLLRRTTYGGRSTADEWYRNDPEVREFFDGLLRRACERSVFDGETIRRLRREHLSGEANHMITSLAAVTTLELWMERNLD